MFGIIEMVKKRGMNNKHSTINVAKELAPILASRDITAKLASLVAKTESRSVDLDFSEVEFISRSAAHELLSLKNDFKNKWFKNKELNFVNVNDNIKEMLRVVAANIAMPKSEKVEYKVERVDINSLFRKSEI